MGIAKQVEDALDSLGGPETNLAALILEFNAPSLVSNAVPQPVLVSGVVHRFGFGARKTSSFPSSGPSDLVRQHG